MSSKIKISVGGITYTVKSDENEEYLSKLVNELETKFRNLSRKNPSSSTTMIAIMAALESSDDAKKSHAEIIQLKKYITRLENENITAKQQKMRFKEK